MDKTLQKLIQAFNDIESSKQKYILTNFISTNQDKLTEKQINDLIDNAINKSQLKNQNYDNA